MVSFFSVDRDTLLDQFEKSMGRRRVLIRSTWMLYSWGNSPGCSAGGNVLPMKLPGQGWNVHFRQCVRAVQATMIYFVF